MKTVLVTGGFDPLHSGHIEYFKSARALGDQLVVGINSDRWLSRKKGKPFMSWDERCGIIENLSMVTKCLKFNDDDGTAIDAINRTLAEYDGQVIFANGGDRDKDNIPEMKISDPRLSFAFSVGGNDKRNSSSWILKDWTHPTTYRIWGSYTVLQNGQGWQVKELSFGTEHPLSDQRHFFRSEHWYIVEGNIRMDLEFNNGSRESKVYGPGESIDIPAWTWHKAYNVGNTTAKVIEVWMGNYLSEDDIERRD